jgi:hypothetical protein
VREGKEGRGGEKQGRRRGEDTVDSPYEGLFATILSKQYLVICLILDVPQGGIRLPL